MATEPQLAASASRIGPMKVIIVSSVMFTFISYWRTAAVVLCDMSSTAYYIGAIVENAIGQAAPWFILAVLCFSFGINIVYIESCSIFVRGGVYRVVKEALGGFLAKASVSALLFDYILTGPISGVSAGQYILGLCLEAASRYADFHPDEATKTAIKNWGSVLIACGITLYFFRENLLGLHESSDKALKIMIATTVMAVAVLSWSGITLAAKGPVTNSIPFEPDLHKKYEIDKKGEIKRDAAGQPIPKINPITGKQEDPLGFLGFLPGVAEPLRDPGSWLSLVGAIGIIIAFGHSILAMSGAETLGQVYREVESPKLPNFKKAALIVFLYSLILTGSISFLAVLLIPREQRLSEYSDNLIGGLAMNLYGPLWALLLMNAFVVIVGCLILSGAVNTSIIGANGVLNRVAEDGVLPDWFLKPHSRYGTPYRVLLLIVGLQIVTIIASRGDIILLGEAYAFGVVWSFVFKTLAMVVLRFKDRTPRVFKVPLNVRVRGVELPIGLSLIFLIVALAALANFLTKEVATVSGVAFTGIFLALFSITERHYEKRRRGAKHEHRDQFNKATAAEITPESLGLTKTYRKVVAIRSTQNLFMLETALAETDPETTDVVVMTAKLVSRGGEGNEEMAELDAYDQELMTAVVQRAEKAGKPVHPLIMTTNNPLHTILQTVRDLQAQEVVVGGSNIFLADEQMEQIAFFWITLNAGETKPLTVRILSRDRDVYFDLGGGNRIPKITERRARSVEELRAGGVGVDRVMLVNEGTMADNDLFQAVLTMLDPNVKLAVAAVKGGLELARHIEEQSEQLKREVSLLNVNGEPGPALVKIAKEDQYDVIVVGLPQEAPLNHAMPAWAEHILRHAHCRVFLASAPNVPRDVAE